MSSVAGAVVPPVTAPVVTESVRSCQVRPFRYPPDGMARKNAKSAREDSGRP
jgi:hypothetical protein